MIEPIKTGPHPMNGGGTQEIYRFDNGYGASVVQFWGSYGYSEGLWELAVILFDSDGDDDYTLTYGTPVTDDVIGHLTLEQVQEHLVEIQALSPESSRHGGAGK